MASPDAPNVIGNYQLGDVLGRGAFAAVYKGLDVTTGAQVAVKMLKVSKLGKAQLSNIMTEVELMQRLDDEHIVQYLDCIKSDAWLGIVLEFAEGGSLQSIQKRFGTFPEPLVSRYVGQVLQGLAYLHEQGVVHRDIKGANILTTKQGHVKLADFGVATNQSSAAGDSNVAGTPYWMAPEIIELSGATTASDIWSVGCTIIELLTGQPPYYDLAQMSALFRIVQDVHPPLPDGVSPALRDFLLQCFQKDPNLRVSAATLCNHRWIKQFKAQENQPPVAGASAARKEPAPDPGKPKKAKKEKKEKKKEKKAERKKDAAKNAKPSSKKKPAEEPADEGRKPKSRRAELRGNAKSVSRRKSPSEDKLNPDSLLPKRAAETPTAKVRSNTSSVSSTDMRDTVKPPIKPPIKPQIDPIIKKPEPISDDEDWDAEFGSDDDEDKPMAPPKSKTPKLAVNLLSGSTSASPAAARQKIMAFVEGSDDDFGDEDFDLGDGDGGVSGELKIAVGGAGEAPAVDMTLNLSDEDEEDDDVLADENPQVASGINRLVQQLATEEDDAAFVRICSELVDKLRENPLAKSYWIRHHGVVAVMEMLVEEDPERLYQVMRVINQVVADNDVIKENLCLIGGLPTIMRLAVGTMPASVRRECLRFLREMLSTNSLTLQMFIACNGIEVISKLLLQAADALERVGGDGVSENDAYELAQVSVEGMYHVIFSLKDSNLPRNDFCRLMVRTGLSLPLARILRLLLTAGRPDLDEHVGRTLEVVGVLANQDSVVKLALSQVAALREMLSVLPKLPVRRMVLLLRALKALSGDSRTLGNFQEVGAIRELAVFKDRPEAEIQNQLLPTLFNLCRIDQSRQREAVSAGLLPYFVAVFVRNSTQKQFALQLLCEFANNRDALAALRAVDGASVFVDVLVRERRTAWPKTVLESLAAWYEKDPSVGEVLVKRMPEIASTIIEQLAPAMPSLLRLSNVDAPFAAAVAQSELLPALLRPENLKHMAAAARISAVRILRVVIPAAPDPLALIRQHNISAAVKAIRQSDPSVVVKEACRNVLRMIDNLDKKK